MVSTRVSLVPESLFSQIEELDECVFRAVANLAVESVKSLSESKSRAWLALPEERQLIASSSFLLRSLFFFCRNAETLWYRPLQLVQGSG